jgi:hypothetical protein
VRWLVLNMVVQWADLVNYNFLLVVAYIDSGNESKY